MSMRLVTILMKTRVVVRVAVISPTNHKKNTHKNSPNPHAHPRTTKNPTETARNGTSDQRTKTTKNKKAQPPV